MNERRAAPALWTRIWETVEMIPPGQVASYGQVAEEAGLPGRARLVGRVLGLLPKGSPVPWHRVLRSGGTLAFARESAAGQEQRRRLEQEGVSFRGNRVDWERHHWRP